MIAKRASAVAVDAALLVRDDFTVNRTQHAAWIVPTRRAVCLYNRGDLKFSFD